jgi:hypothetical protein
LIECYFNVLFVIEKIVNTHISVINLPFITIRKIPSFPLLKINECEGYSNIKV